MTDEKKETPRNPIDKDKELKALQAAAASLQLLEVRLCKLLTAQRDALMIETKGTVNNGEPECKPTRRR